jgi:ribonuclease HII
MMVNPDQTLLCGVDDATKCPCIGSIFVAGVVADIDTVEWWRTIGVTDSKLLTRRKRDRLARIIRKTALATSVKHITPDLIDDKSLNLNAWEMLTAFQIIQNLRRRFAIDRVHIDNWEVNLDVFRRRMNDLTSREMVAELKQRGIRIKPRTLRSLTLIPEHQADEKYTVVGAASILAKSGSDRQYDQYRKRYGDFGSGNPGDPKTRKFLWDHRQVPLPIIRTSWRTFQLIREINDINSDPLYSRMLGRLARIPDRP